MNYIILYYVDAILAGLCAGLALWLALVMTLALRPGARLHAAITLQLAAGGIGHLLLAHFVGTPAVVAMWLVVLCSASSCLLSESLSAHHRQLQQVNRNGDLLAAHLRLRQAELAAGQPAEADCAA